MKVRKALVIFAGSLSFVFNTLFANTPEIIEDENGEPISIKLNLPQELINICKNEYWALNDDVTKGKVENILTSQENFDEWCAKQEKIDNKNPVKLRNVLRQYAYILLLANDNQYNLNGDFCKKVELDRILGSIYLKGATPCCCCYRTEAEKYIRNIYWIIQDF